MAPDEFVIIDFDDLSLNSICAARSSGKLVVVHAKDDSLVQWYLGWIKFNVPKELLSQVSVILYPYSREELAAHLIRNSMNPVTRKFNVCKV